MANKWLDDREERAWRGFHRMRADLLGHLGRQLTRQSGLTEADYSIFITVLESPGQRIRARDIGLALGWERSRVSHQIARMEARGSVKRSPCYDDARGFDVELTAAGIEAFEGALPAHFAEVRRCFADVLTPEQLDVLGDIAERITVHLADSNAKALNGCQRQGEEAMA